MGDGALFLLNFLIGFLCLHRSGKQEGEDDCDNVLHRFLFCSSCSMINNCALTCYVPSSSAPAL